MTPPVSDPFLPPLLRGAAVPADRDPFAAAVAAARSSVEPGLVVWSHDRAAARAAIVLAPEMPLGRAVGAVFAVQLALADSIGALGPPELALHLVWPDSMKLNGALCGRFRMAASTADPQAEPDWLVTGFDVPLLHAHSDEPGAMADHTTLCEEGFPDLAPQRLIESWSRHLLVWINRFLDDGFAPLRAAWSAKCADIGLGITAPEPGRFLGLDEHGGLLLELAGAPLRVIRLTSMLETPL